ncbi:MAG TPA: type IV pilus modification protein PilV [Pseudomonas sp.]|uniref:type IV pilus modification protein PilV n=1 Tax=Pseudomonas sp. TaxID=306 RepID=UPI002ED91395
MTIGSRANASGFSMIEVLVSLLITVIGVLGMVALQSKAIPYTQDSVQRNTAIMLADDLLEIIRTNGTCTPTNSCLKAPGASFPASADKCIPTPSALNQQIGCWAVRAGNALPGANTLLSKSFYICRSIEPRDATVSACATENLVDTDIEIQVAWTVKAAGECLDPLDNSTTCTYRVRTRLK